MTAIFSGALARGPAVSPVFSASLPVAAKSVGGSGRSLVPVTSLAAKSVQSPVATPSLWRRGIASLQQAAHKLVPGFVKPVQHGLAALFLAGAANFVTGCGSDVNITRNDPNHWTDFLEEPQEIHDLDVLVVLDTSCSMVDDQQRVGSGMLTLRDDIDGLVDNTQFGFITTDPDYPGFVGPYDSAETLPIAMAPGNLPLNSAESGFASTYNWYQGGQTFLRDDASLLIFFISDEEEQSGLAPSLWYSDFFSQLKLDDEGNPLVNKADVVAITTLPAVANGCDDVLPGDTTHGCNYIKMVRDHYNKEPVNIESDDWENWLSGASFLTALEDQIRLSRTPQENSIKVYREGVLLPQSDWQYVPNPNLVQLNFVPDYGDDIAVSYLFDD